MERYEIIDKIGPQYFKSNMENGEFSYPKAFADAGKEMPVYWVLPISSGRPGKEHKFLDIRFESDRLVILVETKNKFSKWSTDEIENQLQTYVRYEKSLTNKKIVAILAETEGDQVWVWHGKSVIIDDDHRRKDENTLKSFEEYDKACFGKVNERIKVVDSIKNLNEMLHTYGVKERLRSQFVGTCLLALNNGLQYKGIKEKPDPKTGKNISRQAIVLSDIKEILEGLLKRSGTIEIGGKLAILNNRVLDNQDVQHLTYDQLTEILSYIDEHVIPYINDDTTAGQDLLNLFFTTFNKYVGKADKNQAFTPDHICDFMSKAIDVNKNSRVLDPCCGSGAFLVRAMTDAMDDCDTEEERNNVKKNQIFGIEFDDDAFGLASTNMLIHGDGNSNVIKDSMFNRGDWIRSKNINKVLMNPPYNATRNCCNPEYTTKWGKKIKEDPSKGFHFVEWVANHVSTDCKMAVLLPTQAAISGSNKEIIEFKKKMLSKYTLDAVFSLPTEMFYPGASAVAVCMIFDLSQKHEKAHRETFFGYFRNDNFIKRKGLGRVEKTDEYGNSLWDKTEKKWLDLYKNRKTEPGLSITKYVTAEDDWLAEAYMETDYSDLSDDDFQKSINEYLSYLVKEGLV